MKRLRREQDGGEAGDLPAVHARHTGGGLTGGRRTGWLLTVCGALVFALGEAVIVLADMPDALLGLALAGAGVAAIVVGVAHGQ